MPRTDAPAVARLRKLCLALPGAVEKRSHGEPTWFAGEKGKVFAALDDHHHGAEHLSVWVPLPLGAQEALVARDPRRFFRPPYVGGKGWVAIVLDGKPDWAEVARLVREAFLKVAGPKLRARLAGGGAAERPRIFGMPFADVYPLYVHKAARKGRTKDEVDEIVSWLTGRSREQLRRALADGVDLEGFFDRAPRMNPKARLITGVVCGVRVEEIADPLMQKIRYLDKLIDELARGKPLESILRR